MEEKSLTQYLKPKVLNGILERNAAVLEVPMRLLDSQGRKVADSRREFEAEGGFGHKIGVPLTVKGNMVGTLIGYEGRLYQGRRLKSALVNVGQNITDLISGEIKLDSMSEELLHNYKVLNLFYNMSNALVNILDVHKVCLVILERIVSTIGLAKASVLLLDKSGEFLQVVAHKGLPDGEVKDAIFPVAECVIEEAVVKAKPLFIQDIDRYPALKKRSKGRYRSESFISVPIVSTTHVDQPQVLGVINIADKLSGEPFYSGDMKLILALTSLAAMSIRNAQNFEGVKRSKEEWESTFDAITDSVAILDREYRLVKVNKAYRESQRSEGDGLIGQTCHRLFYQEEDPCPDCPAVETLRTKQPAYAEKRVGEKIFRQWTYPIKNRKDDSISVVMYTRDVTNLKTLKDRLVRSERMATIGQFAAGMAHEIRNPLGSIVTAADVLSTQVGTGQEDWTTLTDVMKLEARRLNEIITEFLLYAAPRRPEIAAHDLNRLVEDMMPMIRAEAEQKGMHVESSLDPAVGGGLFDPDKIRQVIWNLVINGIQAMEMGQTLTVATGQGPEGVTLIISDEGAGISETDRKRIFDPFFTTKSRGSGLGLSIVSRIVEDHEGRIEVASRPGQGTDFTVLLPQENQVTKVLSEVQGHG